MTLSQCYAMFGGDYQETVARLCSERLVSRFLLKFLDEPTYGELSAAMEAREGETAFRSAHTLKGVALNLGLTELHRSADTLTEALRGGWTDRAPELMAPVTESYRRTIAAITAWRDSQ